MVDSGSLWLGISIDILLWVSTRRVWSNIVYLWDGRLIHLRRCHGVEQEQWDKFLSLMQEVHFKDHVDRLVWLLDVSDSFFVSSTRLFLDNGMLPSAGMES